MKCANCEKEFDLTAAIEKSPFSWPQSNTIWYECPQCRKGIHIRFTQGQAQIIEPQGSPGYEYDVISTYSEPTIEVRVDPAYLHIWYLGKHYEVQERA